METFGGVINLKDNVSGVLKQASTSSKSFGSEVKKAKQELEKLDKQKMKEKEIRIKNTAAYKAIEGVKKKLEPITKKVIELKAKEERVVEKIGKIKKQLEKIPKSKVVTFVAKGAEGIGKAVTALGKTAILGSAAALTSMAAAGGVAIAQAIDFQAEMKNVSTLLDGDVDSKLVTLGDDVKKISSSTGIAAKDLASGLYEVVSAFGESADSTQQLEIAAKAAKAGNAETSDSVKMLAAVTKGYGDTSAEAVQKAADLAFETVKLGQTSFPELASSMGAVIPLASTLKVSQEELFGAMATLTGVTGGTAEVTTQLKATMQGFMSPSTEMSKALKKLGYSSGAAALESEGLGGILTKLKDSVKGDEVAFASLFSSVEAKNAVLALAGTQAENFATKTEAMSSAGGAADEAFKRQTSSVKEMAAKIKNQGLVILTSLGEKALPVVTTALEKVSEYMPMFESAVDSAFSTIEPIVDGAVQLFDAMTSKWGGTLSGAGPMLQGAISSIFPGIASIATEMGGKISAAISMISSHTELFRSIAEVAGPALSAVASSVWTVAGPLFDLAVSAVDLLLTGFEVAFPKIQSVVEECWSVIEPIISAVGKGIETVSGALGKISGKLKSGSGSGGSVGHNANGTSYWKGGYTQVGEHGPELVDLPTGAKVYSNSKTNNIMTKSRPVQVTIQNMTVREEADVHRIAEEIVKELDKVDR